jgi:hypothetical protein
MKTQNLIILTLAMVFITQNPYAQSSSKVPVNSLKGGKWAVSFLLGTPRSSENFGSLNLSLKSQITKIFAIRLGASAYLSYGKGNNTSEGFYYNQQSQSSTNADIFLNFMFYTNPSKPLSFYAGLGPVYQYNEYKSDYLPSGSLYSGTSYTSARGYAFGGYNLSYTYGISNGTSTYFNTGPKGEHEYDVSTFKTDTQTLNLNIVKVGFSAYF